MRGLVRLGQGRQRCQGLRKLGSPLVGSAARGDPGCVLLRWARVVPCRVTILERHQQGLTDHGRARLQSHRVECEAIEDLKRLDRRRPGRGDVRAHQLRRAEGAPHDERRPSSVVVKVRGRQVGSGRPHVRRDPPCDGAAIERCRTFLRERPQDVRQEGLAKNLSRRVRGRIRLEEDGACPGRQQQPLADRRQPPRLTLAQWKTTLGKTDRRGEDLRERHRAALLEYASESGHRPGDSDHSVAVVDRLRRIGVVGPGNRRGRVDTEDGPVRIPHQGLRPPTQPGLGRLGDGQGEGRGDCGVHGVAAATQDLGSGPRGVLRAGDHHPVASARRPSEPLDRLRRRGRLARATRAGDRREKQHGEAEDSG